jgi:predicted DNA-binding transcriptional regulator AlpA
MARNIAEKHLFTFADLVRLGYVSNRMTLNRRIARGEFPPPIKVSARNVLWIRADLDSWLAELLAARTRPRRRKKKR